MNILILGGSRNIAYEASLQFLRQGNTVCFLLRRKDTFDGNPIIQQYIASGHVKQSIGDALNEDDIRKAWKLAAKDNGNVDAVLFSIGSYPRFSVTKGIYMDPPNLCSAGMLNLLATWPKDMSPQPKLIVVTSHGLTEPSYASLPFILKILYTVLAGAAHKDKLGVERLICHTSGDTWKEKEPSRIILPVNWKERVESGWLHNTVVVRPGLLTDGVCVADAKPNAYRTGPDTLRSVWTISRKDVAHFIASKALPQWDEWVGKKVSVAY